MGLVHNGKCVCRDTGNVRFKYNVVYRYEEHIDENGCYFVIDKKVLTKKQFNVSFAKVQLRKRDENAYRSEF